TSANQHAVNSRIELACWLALLVLANVGLMVGNGPSFALIFKPAAVAAGEWWRAVLAPLVHVSRYHLLVDGTAFLLLYAGLEEESRSRRLAWAIFAAAGSLLLPLAIAPELNRIGLCGLSGAAHGLAAISALEMLRQPQQKRFGAFLLAALLLKCAWELWSGNVFLQNLHLGDIGQPIVSTHAGGALGGLLGYGLTALLDRTN
ncbi:MAG: rhombosortase, partial [Desulfuromonadaceae bacterium]